MIYQSGLPGVTEERLQEVETALGCELPRELRNRYKRENKFNVGEWEFHPIKDEQYIQKGSCGLQRTERVTNSGINFRTQRRSSGGIMRNKSCFR
ncbi:MAG: SMI1/KNR4 family protein [Exiguobacterium sp.]